MVAGWCNGSRTYYEPGTGLAWEQAWQLVAIGTATPTADPASQTYPAGRGSYVSGSIVTGADGNNYRCKIPGWCNSDSDLYYAPGTGLAWESAWE